MIARFDIYLVRLDPTQGHEIQKTRPCVIISPDEMNRHLKTVIIAPMSSTSRVFPSRVPVRFQGKSGQIVLDQVRTVDRRRLITQIGKLNRATAEQVLSALNRMFAP